MEEGDTLVPIIGEVLRPPTGNDHAADGDVEQASKIFAFSGNRESRRLVGGCANGRHLLACHRLTDREQRESDADGRVQPQGKTRGGQVRAVHRLSLHRHPDIDHPEHHDGDVQADGEKRFRS